jgi:hypothetical protein
MVVLSATARTVHGLGPDAPLPVAGASLPCSEARWSTPGDWTVRVCTGAATFANITWISLSGGTSSGRRDPRIFLGIDNATKMPLDDVESKRGED